MKIYLVYSSSVVADPESLAETLGGGFDDVIEKTEKNLGEVVIPDAGYVVIQNTWQGFTIHPGPLTAQDIAAFTDPGPSPAEVEMENRRAMRAIIGASSSYIDPAVISDAITRLDGIIASGSVPALTGSPTNADVVAQVRLLTTAVNLVIDAVKDEARIEKGIINYLT